MMANRVLAAGLHGTWVALALLVLAACSLPRETVMPVPLDTAVLGSDTVALPAVPAIEAAWWRKLGDAQLDALVVDALEKHPTLVMALARVDAARSLLDAASARRRPRLSGDASVQAQRLSDAYIIPPPYGGSTRGIGKLQATLHWDLDFWGQQAAAIEQARALEDTAILDQAAARLTLASALVQAYIALARGEARLATAEAMLAGQEAAFALVELRMHSQLDSERELHEARLRVEQARQELADSRAGRELLVHACALLAGKGADYYSLMRAPALDLDASLPLPPALPADLLARRPDLLAARARIDAAAAGREVARTGFYPNVNLTGLAGLQAIGLDRLFSSEAATAGVGAAIHLPIFDGGLLRAAHAGATARLAEAIATYNQAVLSAVRQTTDALSRIEGLESALTAQQGASEQLAILRQLEERRFIAGLASRLPVIESELRLLGARQEVVDLEAAGLAARVQLLVALGGGFEAIPSTTASDSRRIP